MEMDAPKSENQETALVPYDANQTEKPQSNDSDSEPNKGTDWVLKLIQYINLLFSSGLESFK